MGPPRTRRAATSTRSPPSPRSRSTAHSPRLPAHDASQQKACTLGDDAQACEGDKGGRHQALTVPSEDRPYEMDRAPAVTAIRAWPTKTGCAGAGRGRKEQAEGSGCFPTAPPIDWRPRGAGCACSGSLVFQRDPRRSLVLWSMALAKSPFQGSSLQTTEGLCSLRLSQGVCLLP